MTTRLHFAQLAAVLPMVSVRAPIAAAVQSRPTFDGKVALFGSLHNDSALSDDTVAADRPQMTPVMAWEYARAHHRRPTRSCGP